MHFFDPTLNASTSIEQYPPVHLIAAGAGQLIAHQVGVVRAGDEVMRHWLAHVLAHRVVTGGEEGKGLLNVNQAVEGTTTEVVVAAVSGSCVLLLLKKMSSGIKE